MMEIKNIRPNTSNTEAFKQDRTTVPPSKHKSRERKLKKQLKKVKIGCKKAKQSVKRARCTQRVAERERDAALAEIACWKKRLASKDKDVTDALRDKDGFIRLKERSKRDG